jgi:protease-4
MKKCAEEKPVIVSQGDVAASGGYWLSMYADEILVQPTTITGSIGVAGGWVWDDGIGEKVGMEGDFVKAGEHADVFFALRFPFVGIELPHRALSDEERERVFGAVGEMYERFVANVANGRGLSADEAEALAQGRVWTGVQGVENGLADRIGGLQAAIDLAREKAGFERGEEVAVVQYGLKGLFNFDRLKPFPFPWKPPIIDDSADDGNGLGFLTDYSFVYLREMARNNGRALCLIPPEFMPVDDASP